MTDSRRKGVEAERALAKALRDLGFCDAKRTIQGRGGTEAADLEGLPWRVEAKAGSARYVKPLRALRQCMWDAGHASPRDERPCVAITRVDRDRQGWLVTLRFDDLLEIAALETWPGGQLAASLAHVTLPLADFTSLAHEGRRERERRAQAEHWPGAR